MCSTWQVVAETEKARSRSTGQIFAWQILEFGQCPLTMRDPNALIFDPNLQF